MEIKRNESVIQEFKKLSRIAAITNVSLGFLMGLLYIYVQDHLEDIFLKNSYYLGIWAGIGIALSILGGCLLISWLVNFVILRCPSCKKYIGLGNFNFCKYCGTPLK